MSSRVSPLHTDHEDLGARFTTFGGWEMPVEFDSIRTEHVAVRTGVGKFDVSHMGEISVSGPDGTELMQQLTSNDVTSLTEGTSQYATITDEDGIIIDDTVIYRLPTDEEYPRYLFVPNAGNDESMTDRWVGYRDEWGLDARVENRTADMAMIAIQGPDSEQTVTDLVSEDISSLDRFTGRYVDIDGTRCWIARTGYTGEDGFELIMEASSAQSVWNAFECQPCGLGCRDTLRLEAGYLLSGKDFHPETNPRTPFEAGIGFTVSLDTDFVGRAALERVDAEGVDEQFIGFRLSERGIPRHGYNICSSDGAVIGTVTSGTMSPTLDAAIGVGYVPSEFTTPGTEIGIDIRGRQKNAKVESLPFVETL